jgi:hypothetical protein
MTLINIPMFGRISAGTQNYLRFAVWYQQAHYIAFTPIETLIEMVREVMERDGRTVSKNMSRLVYKHLVNDQYDDGQKMYVRNKRGEWGFHYPNPMIRMVWYGEEAAWKQLEELNE